MLDSRVIGLLKKHNVTLEIDLGVHWLHAPHFNWHCAFIPKEDIDYISLAIAHLEKVISNSTSTNF